MTRDEKWFLFRAITIAVMVAFFVGTMSTLYVLVIRPTWMYIGSEQFKKDVEERQRIEDALISWYSKTTDFPANEFLIGVRDVYGDKMVESIRDRAWAHHRAVLQFTYYEMRKKIPDFR